VAISSQFRRDVLLLAGLTVLAIAVNGYHLGAEDQAIYLPAIKQHLDPSLYPTNAEFFQVQTDKTLTDDLIAASIRVSHVPLEWSMLLWHVASIFGLLAGCLRLSRRFFPSAAGQWAAVAMVAGVLATPVAGTALLIATQYLHPRTLAAVAVVFALVEGMDRRWLRAGVLLLLAALLHPQMAFFGAVFLLFMAWRAPSLQKPAFAAALLFPLEFLFHHAPPAWQEAMATRSHYFVMRWKWYELVGLVAPLILLWWFAQIGKRQGWRDLPHFCRRMVILTVLSFVAALVVSTPPFVRLAPFQPMRILHMIYLLFFLFLGGMLGHFVLRGKPARWLALYLPLAAVMLFAQRHEFPASAHIEWPGTTPRSPWLQAFLWVRDNTPKDALFALSPWYMRHAGVDNHGFRALAERSSLADRVKDPGVAALFPPLSPKWLEQKRAQDGWRDFDAARFHELRSAYGVTWVVVESPVPGLDCPYQNEGVLVCRVD
jgi:hypothetical protein